MQPHERRRNFRRIADDEHERLLRFVFNAVGDDRAGTVLRGQLRFCLTVDQLLAHAAIRNELFDRDDRQLVLPGQRVQLLAVRTIARFIQDFAQRTGRQQARHAREVDGRFGMASAAKHAALFSDERKQVSGPMEVDRLARWIANRLDRNGSFGGRYAGASRAVIDGHGIRGAEGGRVGLDHQMQAEPLAGLGQDRHAELSAALRDHEVDRFRCRQLGGADEVALVFAVFSVDDNNDPPLANSFYGLFNRGKWCAHTVLSPDSCMVVMPS